MNRFQGLWRNEYVPKQLVLRKIEKRYVEGKTAKLPLLMGIYSRSLKNGRMRGK